MSEGEQLAILEFLGKNFYKVILEEGLLPNSETVEVSTTDISKFFWRTGHARASIENSRLANFCVRTSNHRHGLWVGLPLLCP